MTDPNKAAVTESNVEFIARVKEITTLYENPQQLPPGAFMRLLALAEERVMIEERRLAVATWRNEWLCSLPGKFTEASQDLSTAIRAVAAKIGEGNG